MLILIYQPKKESFAVRLCIGAVLVLAQPVNYNSKIEAVKLDLNFLSSYA